MDKKIFTFALALMLILSGCSSVPVTGRKQLLLVSDQEVLSSSLTQYNDYMKTATKSTNKTQTAMVTRRRHGELSSPERYVERAEQLLMGVQFGKRQPSQRILYAWWQNRCVRGSDEHRVE